MQKWIRVCRFLIALLLSTSAGPAWADSSAGEALRALKGFHSALRVGLNVRDYQQRLIDTKISVDQSRATETPRAKCAINAHSAMDIDEMAHSLWRTQFSNEQRVPLAMIDNLHQMSVCPNLKPLTTHIREQYANSTDRMGVGVDSSYTVDLLPLLWACAADGIRAAEREMAKLGAKR